MKRISLRGGLLLGLLGAQFSLFGQVLNAPQEQMESKIVYKSQIGPNGMIRCHTMQMDSVRRANNPALPSLEQEEAWLQKEIVKYKASHPNNANESKKAVITIPIIFHVITSGSGATNISATYINAQIDQLNIDYADLAGSSYAVSADCEIQFCPATVDPNGTTLTEPGIHRVNTYGSGPFSDTYVDNTIKPATSWNPNNYFNVWVANLSGGLLGWAQFPSSSGLQGMPSNGGAANTDGVVILYSSVGSVATPYPGGAPYNLGRTLTHESGHWLGLRHVWGDGGCSVDDFCNDTPKSDGANFGCPNTNSCTDSYGAPWPTANPRDMTENYMDYTDDDCMDTYTGDQKIRMQTVLSVSPRRMTLASSNVCSSCASTFSSSTVVEDCNGDNDGSITVAFTGGNQSNATFTLGGTTQSNGTFTGLSQGNYTVTIVDGDNCTSTVNVTLGGPTVINSTTASITPVSFGNDGAININVSGGTPPYTYSWTGPNGFTASSQDINGLAGGVYSVTITDSKGCTKTVSSITVPSNVGIEELANGEFVVYPNPSEGIFNIELIGQATDVFTVSVMDITGRIIRVEKFNDSKFVVDLSDVAAGNYTINIETLNHRMMKRVIVK